MRRLFISTNFKITITLRRNFVILSTNIVLRTWTYTPLSLFNSYPSMRRMNKHSVFAKKLGRILCGWLNSRQLLNSIQKRLTKREFIIRSQTMVKHFSSVDTIESFNINASQGGQLEPLHHARSSEGRSRNGRNAIKQKTCTIPINFTDWLQLIERYCKIPQRTTLFRTFILDIYFSCPILLSSLFIL